MEKLIVRAVENANNAIVAFDNNRETIYGSSQDSKDDISWRLAALSEFTSALRFIEQNKKILSEIKPIINNNRIQSSNLIRQRLISIQEKHESVSIKFSIFGDIVLREKEEDSTTVLARDISFDKDIRADLLNVVNSLSDFQDLFRRSFSLSSFDYVHENRLDELRVIENSDFDLSKLIRLCKELNSAFQNENHLSVAMLVRTILDHVPPIFGYKTFIEVANNYGGKSLKKSLQNLQNSSRNIADAHLHEPIRRKESLPNETQIDFRNDLDVLLGEIVRVLK